MVNKVQSTILEQNGLTRLTFDISGEISVSKNTVSQINAIGYLLPLDLSEKSGGYLLTYNAGSMVSLSKYLRQNKIPKETTVKILKKICISMMSCKENHLFDDNFSFNADHIFWNEPTSELKLVYFPFEAGAQAVPALRSMLAKIFGELLITAEGEDAAYINTIMDFYKQSSFSVKALFEILNQLESEKIPKKKKPNKPVKSPKLLNSEKTKQLKMPKRHVESDNLAEYNFWRRLFKKERKQDLPPVIEQKRSPDSSPAVHAEKPGGTELLIPVDGTCFLAAEQRKSMRLFITANEITTDKIIHSFPCVIGRSLKDADVVLEDSCCSRKHAVIEFKNGSFTIVDNNSSNGVVVGGLKLIPGVPQPVHTGDLIKLGRTELKVGGISGV